jgi:hypothetical protein
MAYEPCRFLYSIERGNNGRSQSVTVNELDINKPYIHDVSACLMSHIVSCVAMNLNIKYIMYILLLLSFP